MYKIDHRKRHIKHHLFVLFIFVVAVGAVSVAGWWALGQSTEPEIKQAAASQQSFDPANTKSNLKIDTPLYTMELPPSWKQIAANRDTRYPSIQWQLQSGSKNRWLEVYSDTLPTDMAFNKIMPVSIKDNEVIVDTLSENCSKFTPKKSETNLKVLSKWQNAEFLCDLSNYTDNIIGVSDKTTGVSLSYTGKTRGKHIYMFVYTDRGIPEDNAPLTTALQSFSPK